MKTLVWKIIFFSVIVVQGMVTVEVERFSSPSINKAVGENATIVWKMKGIQVSIVDVLTINIMKGEPSAANVVLILRVHNASSVPQAQRGAQSVHTELAGRSTANYTYTGKSSDGQETARVSFTINNLILDDEGSYLLTARAISSPTIISVNFGPEKCGSGLETKYTVNPGDELMISSGFCGKPQPNVTCSLNGTLVNTVDITKISQYNYSYTARIPKLEPCDRKEMNCTVAGYGKAYNESTTVIVASNISSFIKNIAFVQDCDKCPTVSWEKEDPGKCDVRYQMQFFNGTNVTTALIELNGNRHSNCSVQAQSVRVTTYEFKQLLANRTDHAQLDYTPCITTTTTTTTIETTTITSSSTSETSTVTSTMSQSPDSGDKQNLAYIIAGVGGAVVAILIAILIIWFFFCRKKRYRDKGKANAIPLEVAADNNAPQDSEGMYAQVDRSNRNQPMNNVSDLYAQVDKKNKSKNQPANSVSDMYTKVDKKKKSKKEPSSNDYAQYAEPQRATAMPSQDLSSMYAQVNKHEDPPKEHTIYSELGPGGGRVGPKPTVQPSNYAEAKDFVPQYSAPQRPPKGSYKASSNNADQMGRYNDGMSNDHEEI